MSDRDIASFSPATSDFGDVSSESDSWRPEDDYEELGPMSPCSLSESSRSSSRLTHTSISSSSSSNLGPKPSAHCQKATLTFSQISSHAHRPLSPQNRMFNQSPEHDDPHSLASSSPSSDHECMRSDDEPMFHMLATPPQSPGKNPLRILLRRRSSPFILQSSRLHSSASTQIKPLSSPSPDRQRVISTESIMTAIPNPTFVSQRCSNQSDSRSSPLSCPVPVPPSLSRQRVVASYNISSPPSGTFCSPYSELDLHGLDTLSISPSGDPSEETHNSETMEDSPLGLSELDAFGAGIMTRMTDRRQTLPWMRSLKAPKPLGSSTCTHGQQDETGSN